MSVLIGIFIHHRRTEISVYDQTIDEFNTRLENDAKFDEVISNFKSEFKEKLMKIYVVSRENSNIDSNAIVDPLIHFLKFDDLDFTNYSPKKLIPEQKIVLIDENSILHEFVSSNNGIFVYKPVKCFEARFDMENHLKLMLQFFECESDQPHIFIRKAHLFEMECGNYLGIIRKENKDLSSFTQFTSLRHSQKAIIYGRYLLNDNVQTLLKLSPRLFLNEIRLNTFNFKMNQAIPLYRAIDTYKPQTRLMGIDLGASRIVVSVSRNGRTELVKIGEDYYSMPSVISFAEDEPIIGNVAIRHLAKKPELVLCDFKHLKDTKRHIDAYWWHFGHCIEPTKSSFVFQSQGVFKQYSTVEIYQILLKKLKKEASEYQSDLNERKDVNQAVVTVPDFDNELMIENVYAAAKLVGLKILDIITETHADLLYFLSNQKISKGETVAVVDIGGGTGFIEKFNFEKGFYEKHDLRLFCGREINNQLERALRQLFNERFKIWPTFNAEQKLEIEKIKEDFSMEEELLLPSTLIKNEDVVLTRKWFEEQVLDKIFYSNHSQVIIKTLKDKKHSSNISKVFLVGGTCRIPFVQRLFKTIFGEGKVVIPNNLQEITATGALIHGLKILNGEIEHVL